ncbi:hypothetical protein AC579_7445 [Pseudocercospora musae]|uniref:Uncharacterized protein n=1 Tax=Pseudocercospora musae TaxID=113226 RepID=A0A139IQG9_9PEZI|nr:hypothetical protein AC579_7445 [Pseudocercospora musae]
MAITSRTLLQQAPRFFSTYRTRTSHQRDRLGAAAVTGYWCAVVSAPLAGAYVISQGAATDKRRFRPLSFRDCLPGSSLDDYAGAYMRLRR